MADGFDRAERRWKRRFLCSPKSPPPGNMNKSSFSDDNHDDQEQKIVDNHIDHNADNCIGDGGFGWDPQYKLFLDNLREDGRSYVLEICLGNKPLVIKYEEPLHESFNGFVTETPKVVRNLSGGKEEMGSDQHEQVPCGSETNSSEVIILDAAAADNDDGDVDDGKDNCVSNLVTGYDLESDTTMDSDYKFFLKYFINNNTGEFVDFKTQKGKGKRKRDDDRDHNSDAGDSNEKAKPSCKKGQNTPSYSCDTDSSDSNTSDEPFNFREKLMDFLRQPYDQKECDELWNEIATRKPKLRHRDLRSGNKTCVENRLGKSYLDFYTDLAGMIDSVWSDKPRVLNLVRGFFFWLKNLSHQGAFFPWKDSSCLDVLPET